MQNIKYIRTAHIRALRAWMRREWRARRWVTVCSVPPRVAGRLAQVARREGYLTHWEDAGDGVDLWLATPHWVAGYESAGGQWVYR